MYFGCPPLIGVRRMNAPTGGPCDFALGDTIFQAISDLKPRLTILAGRWSAYSEPRLGSGVMLTTSRNGGFTKESSRAALQAQLPETIHKLAQISKVLVIKGVPSLHETTDAGLARDPAGFEPARDEYDALEAFPNAIIDRTARGNSGVAVLDPASVMCDPVKCHAVLGGIHAYLPEDKWHLSDKGAMIFLHQFESVVK
jgi:hypothetical protein